MRLAQGQKRSKKWKVARHKKLWTGNLTGLLFQNIENPVVY